MDDDDGWPTIDDDDYYSPGAWIADRLANLKRAWSTGSPHAALAALALCVHSERPPPPWLLTAMADLSGKGVSARDRRNYRANQIHYARWSLVKEGIDRGAGGWPNSDDERGLTLEAAFAAVSEMLPSRLRPPVRKNAHSRRPVRKTVGAEAVKKSYELVERGMRDGRAGQFFQSIA